MIFQLVKILWIKKFSLYKKILTYSVPYLLDEDKRLTETSTILKYLCARCKRTEMLGRTFED